jgi:hypothetical protein
MGTSPRRWIAASAAAAAFAAAFPALGGVVLRNDFGTQVHWNLDTNQANVINGRITLFIEPGGSSQATPGPITEYEAIVNAGDAWDAATDGRIRFFPDSSRPAIDKKASDRVNYVGFKKFVLSSYTLAATFTSTTSAVVTDADVIFNDDDRYVRWSTKTPGSGGYADVQAVATHELGHVAGLDHSPAAEATMYPVVLVGGISSRTPNADDALSARLAYPDTIDPTTGSIFGKVFQGKKAVRRGAVVFALHAADGSVAGSTFCEDTGTYKLPGLAPGPYFVVAVPIGYVSDFHAWWEKSPVNFLPTSLEEPLPDGSSRLEVVHVRAGFPETGNDLHVWKRTKKRAGEPDGEAAVARLLGIGSAASGVFEDAADEDWFRFRADGTNAVNIYLRSWRLGSTTNAAVSIFGPGGSPTLATSLDIRAPSLAANYYGPNGYDMDGEFVRWVPPAPGDYFLRVWPQYSTGTGGSSSFYVLLLLPSDGVPDALRTEATLDPPATRFPAGPPVTLKVVPRDMLGAELGAGVCEIDVTRSDGGAPFSLVDQGDGSYAAEVGEMVEPGQVAFSLTVYGPRGVTEVPAAAVLPVAGAADPFRTTLVAAPRRLEADGTSILTLVLTPRDDRGLLLGPGLDASLAFESDPAGILGPAVDAGNGSYVALLKAPDSPGSAWIASLIAGEPIGTSRLVGFGYELGNVASDLGAESGWAQGLPGLSKKDVSRFSTAEAQLDAVVAALQAGSEKGAATATARATAALVKAAKSPRWAEAGEAAGEVAESLRRRAHAIVDPVVVPVIDPAGQKVLLAARAALAKGDQAMEDGYYARAAKFCAAAIRKVLPLLPE